MKVDVTKTVTGVKGTPVVKTEKENWTYRDVFADALLGDIADPRTGALKHVPGPERYKRGKLAERIYAEDVVDLSIDEAKLLKDLIGEGMTTSLVTPSWDYLESSKEASDG